MRVQKNQFFFGLGLTRAGETIPDICQSKKMALLYHLSLDELIEFDINLTEIQEAIEKSNEETDERIDWTNAWGK